MNKQKLNEWNCFAMQIRIELLNMMKWRRYGHLGGAMSIVELLCVLYRGQLRHDSQNPDWEERDYLVLSKGHSAAALYCTLMLEGYFEREMLYTMNEGGTLLPSHPDRLKTKGIDATTGSLGQGTSIAAGLGMALEMEGKQQYVYLIVGDGELNEGQCWEAFSFIANYGLNRVIVIIDENKKQLDGYTAAVMNPQSIAEKMKSFGFSVWQVDGGDALQISDTLDEIKTGNHGVSCIVLDTIKGQGVDFFERLEDNHSIKFSEEIDQEADNAISALRQELEKGGYSFDVGTSRNPC